MQSEGETSLRNGERGNSFTGVGGLGDKGGSRMGIVRSSMSLWALTSTTDRKSAASQDDH